MLRLRAVILTFQAAVESSSASLVVMLLETRASRPFWISLLMCLGERGSTGDSARLRIMSRPSCVQVLWSENSGSDKILRNINLTEIPPPCPY